MDVNFQAYGILIHLDENGYHCRMHNPVRPDKCALYRLRTNGNVLKAGLECDPLVVSTSGLLPVNPSTTQ